MKLVIIKGMKENIDSNHGFKKEFSILEGKGTLILSKLKYLPKGHLIQYFSLVNLYKADFMCLILHHTSILSLEVIIFSAILADPFRVFSYVIINSD